MSVSYGVAMKIPKIAALEIQSGEDWPLLFFLGHVGWPSFLSKFCSVQYYNLE